MGALIAFQMLSGRVVAPLVQIVALVHEYQETALSVRMLGEIMNRPVEGLRESGGLEPTLAGKIEFDNVTITQPDAARPVLAGVTGVIRESDLCVVAESRCAFEYVFEFAHVSGPAVIQQMATRAGT